MPILALALIPLVVLLAIALTPLALLQRYRAGTSRRRARGWLATLNVAMIGLSTALFVVGAGVTDLWVPRAFAYAVAGVVLGGLLGTMGLRLSRWEPSQAGLHYTPNRWLVLAITLLAAARIVYGLWRSWHAWSSAVGDGPWVASAGIAGSFAAGGVVLGYYLAYWAGVGRRARRHQRSLGGAGPWAGIAVGVARELLGRRRTRGPYPEG